MPHELISALALVFSIFIMWVQRKSIIELESEIWELEKAYKTETGKPFKRSSNVNTKEVRNASR